MPWRAEAVLAPSQAFAEYLAAQAAATESESEAEALGGAAAFTAIRPYDRREPSGCCRTCCGGRHDHQDAARQPRDATLGAIGPRDRRRRRQGDREADRGGRAGRPGRTRPGDGRGDDLGTDARPRAAVAQFFGGGDTGQLR